MNKFILLLSMSLVLNILGRTLKQGGINYGVINGDYSNIDFDDVRLDKIMPDCRGFDKIEYKGVKTRVMTPEYLIAVLLRAGRKKDIEKIEKLLEQTEVDMKKLKNILRKYRLSGKFKLLCMKENYYDG